MLDETTRAMSDQGTNDHIVNVPALTLRYTGRTSTNNDLTTRLDWRYCPLLNFWRPPSCTDWANGLVGMSDIMPQLRKTLIQIALVKRSVCIHSVSVRCGVSERPWVRSPVSPRIFLFCSRMFAKTRSHHVFDASPSTIILLPRSDGPSLLSAGVEILISVLVRDVDQHRK